ncbi:zinc finger CCCH domain protein, putative [Medicago truncatula]|uniref:Zinc finger CCCH domain protein, putative n=1 Tax=Medicago truncatula TaxID=3880 RepID=A0A072VGF0_MEDTR|nr:zinc finger CCCH domain protein, putative [Medicago truncatula]
MDQRFLHHQDHRTRYAPPIHHLPPPPSLPPPPPPQPLPYRSSLPPPPPFHQSPQFHFYPLQHRRIPPQPAWNPNPNPDDRFHRDSHHHHHHHPPPPPPPSYPPLRYESESNPIPRETFVYTDNANYHHHHRQLTNTASTSNHAYPERDDVSTRIDSRIDSTRIDSRIDNRRWLNERKVHSSSPSHSPFESVKDELSATVKRDYRDSETGRYSNGGNSGSRGNSREFNHHNQGREFSRTPPKKQIQKKSALLRIQNAKPNHRNRDAYVNDSNGNFFRGNGKDQHGRGYMKGEDRKKGSPVEVDVDISFESNVFVAKHIVTAAPSTSGVDAGSVPGKLSSVVQTMNDNNNDTSQKNVGDDCNPNEKKEGLISVEASGTHTRKLASKVVKKKKAVSGGENLNANKNTLGKNVGDGCNSHEKNEVGVSGEASGTGTRKLASKVVKKKKSIKRVVKKGSAKPNISGVSAPPSVANAVGETVVADSGSNAASENVKTGTCLEEKINAADKVSAPDDQGNALAEDKKEGLSMPSLGPECRSQEYKNDEASDIGKESRFERGGSISNTPSCVSSILDRISGSDCLDVCNSVPDLVSVTHIDKATKSLNGSTSEINQLDCGNKQLCQSEVSLSPGKHLDVGCSGNSNLVDVGNEMNNNVISADIINTYNSADDGVCVLNSSDPTSSGKETTNSGNNDIDGEAYCEKMVHVFNRGSTSDGNSDTAIPLPSSGMVAFSSLGDTRIQDGQDCLQNTSVLMHGSDIGASSLEESITVHQFGIMKDAEKQVSPGEVPISAENCDIDITFPNSNISLGFDVRDTSKIEKKGVKTGLNGLTLNLDEISLPPVSHSNDADRGSRILSKDPCYSDGLDHSIQSLDFYSLSNQVGDTALHGKRGFSEAEFCFANNDSDDENKVSPVPKRKKVTASLPNLTEFQSEFSDSVVPATSNAEVPICFSDNQEHKKDDVASSSMGMSIKSNAQSIPYSGDTAKRSTDANRETKSSEHLELEHSDMVFTQCEDLAIPNVQFSVFGCERNDNATPIEHISNITGEKIDSQAAETNYHYRDVVQRSPRADMLSNDLDKKGHSLAQENLVSCPADGNGVTISNSNNELIEDLPYALSDMYSQGMTSDLPDRMITEFTATDDDENICGDEENPNSVSMVKHGSDSDAFTSSKQHTEKNRKSDHAIGCSDPVPRNITPEPAQAHSKVTPLGLNSSCSELNGSKNSPGGVIPKAFKGYSFPFPKSKTKTPASSINALKSRTWHRTDNSNSPASLPRVKLSAGIVPPKRPILEKKNFPNTSYIRKGNSLVRNPTPVAAIPQISSSSFVRRPTPVSAIPQISNNPPSLGLGETPKGTKPENRAVLIDQPIYSKTYVSNTLLQRTSPLHIDTKSEENISSPLLEPPSSGFCENASDLGKFIETNDAPACSEDVLKQYETPENQTAPSSNGECEDEANVGYNSSLNSKRIVYIKPKTNQLVATSTSSDIIVSTDDKGQTAIPDSYYKKRKNQLVRTTFDNHVNQTVATPNNVVNSDGQGDSKVLRNRRFSKRRSHKVAGISSKSSRASLVWTLGSKNSSGNDRDSRHYQKVLPLLSPWKRTTYLRSFIHNSASSFNSCSLSAVGKKLLLLRKRDTVYTRSTRGFSLWKSKVLGIGGSSLKWSKSIEKHSKKANEEATLAVAAVEKKKREKKDPACVGPQTKRERIFRVGSVRYRMDPSRRTLQRISDDESLSSASIGTSLVSKRGYIPRRLVIGNDEYVRIGNGNQLIRDPKKRTRKLAIEKVRWSLHTARQRLARKQKYCQFFTRFGKCNKDGGKCPYIHDPSKIAVCTKFLNGLCSSPNCKLTHKVLYIYGVQRIECGRYIC